MPLMVLYKLDLIVDELDRKLELLDVLGKFCMSSFQ